MSGGDGTEESALREEETDLRNRVQAMSRFVNEGRENSSCSPEILRQAAENVWIIICLQAERVNARRRNDRR